MSAAKSIKQIESSVKPEEIKASIKKLGQSCSTITRTLKQHKITGIPYNSRHCAIAMYLKKEFPKEKRIDVDNCKITVNGSTIDASGTVLAFIRKYDNMLALRNQIAMRLRELSDKKNSSELNDIYANSLAHLLSSAEELLPLVKPTHSIVRTVAKAKKFLQEYQTKRT